MALKAVSIKAHGKSKQSSPYDEIVDKAVALTRIDENDDDAMFILHDGDYGVNARFLDQDGSTWFADCIKGVEITSVDMDAVIELTIQIRKATKDVDIKRTDGSLYTVHAGDHKAYITDVKYAAVANAEA